MKKLIVPALLLSMHSSAQFFQAHYGTVHDEDAFAMVETPDHGFIVCGSSMGTGSGGKDAVLTKVNQGGAIEWSKDYGGSGDETAIYVKQASGNTYIFCGETFSQNATGDAFVALADSVGNLLWWKDYGGAGYDVAYSARAIPSGGFIVSGLTENGSGNYDAFLMRLDANGDSLWTRTLGGSSIDHAVQAIPTSDNGFLFSGKILSYGSGSSDIWLVKTNGAGDTLWTETIGGPGWDEGMDLMEIQNGYIICGGTNTSGAGDYDFLLMQIDLNGQLQWGKTYGGDHVEASYSVKEVPSGGYIFCGYSETFGPGHARGTDSANAFVVRTDVNGDTLWSMAYGGLLKEECFSVVNCYSGGFAICGYTGSFGDSLQAYIFRMDDNGYTGCNERRAQPDIGTPPFVITRHAVNVMAGMTETSPLMLVMNNGSQQNALCGGPLVTEEHPRIVDSMFPDPASDELTIVTGFNQKCEVLIRDVSGRIVKELSFPSGERMMIDVSAFVPGEYYLEVNSGGQRETSPFVICR